MHRRKAPGAPESLGHVAIESRPSDRAQYHPILVPRISGQRTRRPKGETLSFIHGLLGLKKSHSTQNDDPRAIQAIRGRLEELSDNEARYLAAFAYVLARVAYADLEVDANEIKAMQRLVHDHTDLDSDKATLVVDIATSQAKTLGGTQDFVVTKLLKGMTTAEKRLQILDCLLAVAAADDLIVGEEEREMRKVARELGITDKDFLSALSRYRDKRSVLKDWPG